MLTPIKNLNNLLFQDKIKVSNKVVGNNVTYTFDLDYSTLYSGAAKNFSITIPSVFTVFEVELNNLLQVYIELGGSRFQNGKPYKPLYRLQQLLCGLHNPDEKYNRVFTDVDFLINPEVDEFVKLLAILVLEEGEEVTHTLLKKLEEFSVALPQLLSRVYGDATGRKLLEQSVLFSPRFLWNAFIRGYSFNAGLFGLFYDVLILESIKTDTPIIIWGDYEEYFAVVELLGFTEGENESIKENYLTFGEFKGVLHDDNGFDFKAGAHDYSLNNSSTFTVNSAGSNFVSLQSMGHFLNRAVTRLENFFNHENAMEILKTWESFTRDEVEYFLSKLELGGSDEELEFLNNHLLGELAELQDNPTTTHEFVRDYFRVTQLFPKLELDYIIYLHQKLLGTHDRRGLRKLFMNHVENLFPNDYDGLFEATENLESLLMHHQSVLIDALVKAASEVDDSFHHVFRIFEVAEKMFPYDNDFLYYCVINNQRLLIYNVTN